MNEKESMRIIREMTGRARYNLKKDSFHYLLWGWMVFAAAALQLILLNWTAWEYHWLSWPVLMTTSAVIALVYGWRQRNRARYSTHIDRNMAYLWGAFVAVLALILLSAPTIGWVHAYALCLALYGLGTFVSGGMLGFRPLIAGGISVWVLGAIPLLYPALFDNFSNMLVLLMLGIAVSYIIPGHLLRKVREDGKN